MSKIKIYDGVVIDMATSEIIEYGKVSYVDSKEISNLGGGGGGEEGRGDCCCCCFGFFVIS